MVDSYSYGTPIPVSSQMLDYARSDQAVREILSAGVREAVLDMTDGPRLGPRWVMNDADQADLDRRQALAQILIDVAEERGVDDLVGDVTRCEDCW